MTKRKASLEGNTPVRQAARVILATYRREVRRFARLVVRQVEPQPEPVHQLRVWTRRWSTALWVFADGYPRRKVHRIQQKLREIRQAAGETRRLDVLLASVALLEKQFPVEERDSLKSMTKRLLAERNGAHERLARYLQRVEEMGFWEKSKRQFRNPRRFSNPDQLLESRSRESIAEALVRLEKRHSTFVARGDFSSLHRLRLAGKRVRYALEIFAGNQRCPEEEQLAQSLRELLKLLGNLNDLHEFSEQLDSLGCSPQEVAIQSVAQSLAEQFRHKLRQGLDEFESRWNLDFVPAKEGWKSACGLSAREKVTGKAVGP